MQQLKNDLLHGGLWSFTEKVFFNDKSELKFEQINKLNHMSIKTIATNALEQGKGILRLTPTWVPRSFCIPGRRIKLHPDDYYSFGGERGGIDERWFSSTTPADNGPLTSENEGLSKVVIKDGKATEEFIFRDAIDELKGEIIGEGMWNKHGCWPMYSKFFDNLKALPFHIHQDDDYAGLTGQVGKPEA